ncbi:MAG: hypothetical protein JNN22_03585 [Rhodospirillales bacterium]|nr:hypothetical protein [Rhodospirillales bacterium]
MDPITIALGLAQIAPGLIRWISGDDKSKAAGVADQVLTVAKAITGKADPREAVDAIKADPALALQFQVKVMEHERAWWQEETERLRIDATDRANARQREIDTKDATTKVLAVLVVVMAAGACTALLAGLVDGLKDPITAALVGSTIGSIFSSLNQVLQYYFGSSSSSRDKDATVKALAVSK